MSRNRRVAIVAATVAAVVVAVTGCGRANSGAPDRRVSDAAAHRCASARPASPTAAARTFSFRSTTRAYLLALPAGYDGVTRYPLIVDFAGFKASKELQETNTSMGVKGSARGFIVATPDALGNPQRWNTPGAAEKADDFGFVHALVADLSGRLCVDSRRVYAAGHSNGSQFAARLVCQAPYVFSAVALVSGTTPSECPAGIVPSILSIHGTADAAVPYRGGVVAGNPFPVVPDVITSDAGRYRCSPAPVNDSPATGVDRLRYTGCTQGSEIVFDTVVGGTHPWPAGPVAVADPSDSLAGKIFSATDAILDFFAARASIP
jgi:polyhydroxybutyrate depolymerase